MSRKLYCYASFFPRLSGAIIGLNVNKTLGYIINEVTLFTYIDKGQDVRRVHAWSKLLRNYMLLIHFSIESPRNKTMQLD